MILTTSVNDAGFEDTRDNNNQCSTYKSINITGGQWRVNTAYRRSGSRDSLTPLDRIQIIYRGPALNVLQRRVRVIQEAMTDTQLQIHIIWPLIYRVKLHDENHSKQFQRRTNQVLSRRTYQHTVIYSSVGDVRDNGSQDLDTDVNILLISTQNYLRSVQQIESENQSEDSRAISS